MGPPQKFWCRNLSSSCDDPDNCHCNHSNPGTCPGGDTGLNANANPKHVLDPHRHIRSLPRDLDL